MIHTIITIEESDKRWLDRYSRQHNQSTAETIRLAIKEFKKKAQEMNYQKALKDTAGLLRKKGDSVQFVRRLRKEWV